MAASSERRRARADAEDSRERIRREALALFGRFGYDAVSLQRIADAVGLHKSSLFHHYASKYEIVTEVLEEVLGLVVAELEPLQEAPSTLEPLLIVSDRLTDLLCHQPATARLLLGYVTAPDDSELRGPNTPRVEALERALFEGLGGWLSRAKQSGVIRPLNLRQAMVNLVGLVLFYPAVAPHLAGGQIAGPEPFSKKAIENRKAELRLLLTRLLEPHDDA
jgi:AcrR family transcriptional regulator